LASTFTVRTTRELTTMDFSIESSPTAPSERSETMNMPAIHDQYDCIAVKVDLARVRQAEDGVRSQKLSGDSNEKFKAMFRNPKAYGDNKSFISVCVLGLDLKYFVRLKALVRRAGNTIVNIHRLPGEEFELKDAIRKSFVTYVDGVRRGNALCDEEVLQASPNNRYAQVWMYYRKDGVPMEGHDVLLIGGVLNAYASNVVKMTNSDNIYLVNSYLRQLRCATFPGGYPHKIESNRYLKKRMDKLRTNPMGVKSGDVGYIVTQMGLLPHLKDTQARTVSIVALNVFRHHDEHHNEKKLFDFITAIPLRALMYEFIWECTTLHEQLFVLTGIKILFLDQKRPAPRSHIPENVRKRPQVIREEHYKSATHLSRRLWTTLLRRITNATAYIFQSVNSVTARRVPWKTTDMERASYADHLFGIVTRNSLVELLIISCDLDTLNSKCNEWVETLAADFCINMASSNTSAIDIADDMVLCTPKRRKRKSPRVIETTEEESDAESAEENAAIMTKLDNIPDPSAKLRKLGGIANRATSTHSRTNENELNVEEQVKDAVYEKNLEISRTNWARAKALLHRSETDGREVWHRARYKESNEVDEFGFSITYRHSNFIAWNPPNVRREGFLDFVPETVEDFRGLGFQPEDYEMWWKGTVRVIGSSDTWSLRLFEDNDRGYSRLDPSFRLNGTLKRSQPEITIPWLPQHSIPKLTERLWPKNPRVQVIIRALGFRPPHRVFLTSFSINDYRGIRSALMASILHYRPDRFHHLRMANTDDKGGPSAYASNMVTSEVLTNYLRYSRELLDATGFVIFENLFNSLREIPVKEVWPTMSTVMRNDILFQSATKFINHWMQVAPTSAQIIRAELSPAHFLSWSGIRNTTENEELQIGESSRLMHTKYAATSYYEEQGHMSRRLPVLKSKCNMEIALMQLSSWLRLAEKEWDETSGDQDYLFRCYQQHYLSAPETGGRLIIMGTDSTRNQVPHLDYTFSESESINSDGSSSRPPYFCMISFMDHVPLWILEGSHKLLSEPYRRMKQIGTLLPLKMITIPPWSCIIIRGDILHAGAGGTESIGKRAPRFHMYMMRKGVALGDSINDCIGRHFHLKRVPENDSLVNRVRQT